MEYFWGILIGLAWGAAAALLNAKITKHFLAKNSSGAMLAANLLHVLVDITAMAAALLLRMTESISFYTAIVGTAVSLSMLTIIFAFKMSKP